MQNCLSKNAFYQLCRYGVGGGIGAGIDFGLFAVIMALTPLNYLLANAISFATGTIVAYYIQKKWTFQCQSNRNIFVFGKFVSAVIITFLLNNLILITCVSFLQLDPIKSKIIQIIISFFWGYTINKKFVFK